MSGARGCWSDVMKLLLVRLGLATEDTTTPLRRQRATAIPSRPVTAPAEQVFSCVQVCSKDFKLQQVWPCTRSAAEGLTLVDQGGAEHRRHAGGQHPAAHHVPRAASASRQQLLCMTGPHPTLQLQMQPAFCDQAHPDSVSCSLHLRQMAASGAIGLQKDPHRGLSNYRLSPRARYKRYPELMTALGAHEVQCRPWLRVTRKGSSSRPFSRAAAFREV